MRARSDDHSFKLSWRFSIIIDDINELVETEWFGDDENGSVISRIEYKQNVYGNPRYGQAEVAGDPLDRERPRGYIFSSRRVDR